jgi:dipeptidyl aminopeptidase/acylaminoacyl peptidase
VVDVLTADASVLLVRHETATSPPNYRVVDSHSGATHALTHNVHPVPRLKDSQRLRLEYRRDDGLELAASLYLPPGYDGQKPLPAVVWAYPRRFADGASADAIDSRARFMTFERAFRLFFLLRGYAVLDDVSMPIVGNQADANDTFVEQIVANAQAAVAAAQATGFVDAARIGIAGHSYGAFMVANLLAHARLFSAGIALSGAYNRTLTPFGFQTERRTLWEAPETYLAMSPLLYSHQIEAPLLLVHGLRDDNAGTSPLQSTQFYQAIRGNAGKTELLLLPWEGHSYRARESVLRTAGEMLDWFDRHVKNRPLDAETRETGAFARPSQ